MTSVMSFSLLPYGITPGKVLDNLTITSGAMILDLKKNLKFQICKFFLSAVENNKYGWFWECPNGPSCHYRHALPPGEYDTMM